MRGTYAYNSIIFGLLLGLWAMVKAGIVIGIIVAIAVSVVGFFIIRTFENAIFDGVERGVDAVSNAMRDRKKEKEGKSGTQDLADRYK